MSLNLRFLADSIPSALTILSVTCWLTIAIKPFLVFAAAPNGFVGAVAALWIMGAPFDSCPFWALPA